MTTWEPTHVQFTVLRARNLVGKLKGKSSAKITDVFVTISLGKEKFQTSTVKYAGKVSNGVEWFEECDLSIPGMDVDVNVSVMNRGLLSDEFIGYVAVPLHQYSAYDRPSSQWLPLQQKPSKLPDGRCRGEIEVRLTFHVKSRTDETSPGGLKGKRAGSIKSLVTAVGDKFKFTRSRSLRGEGRQQFSTPQPSKGSKTTPTNPASRSPSSGRSSAPRSTNSVNFDAVDVYVPEQCWRDNEIDDELGDGNFARSYSLTMDKRRSHEDFKSRSMMNLPSENAMTLPNPRRRPRPSLDDSVLPRTRSSPRSSRSSRSSVTSQEGYLENMFRKECEVGDRMNEVYSDDIEEESEEEYDNPRRRSAQEYHESEEHSGSGSGSGSGSSGSSSEESSELDTDEEITLPKVKLKQGASAGNLEEVAKQAEEEDDDDNVDSDRDNTRDNNSERNRNSSNRNSSNRNSSSYSDTQVNNVDADTELAPDVFTHRESSDYSELDRVIARENSRRRSDTLNSQGSTRSAHSSSSSISYRGKSAAERAFDRGSSDSMPEPRRRISPQQDFSFTGLPQQPQYSGDDQPKLKRRPRQYAKNGRRYTIQGLEGFGAHRSAPDIRGEHRLSIPRGEDIVPEDLMAVYRNMTRDELIRLVVTHKAQIIRKDQYIKDLESYIDGLLVRVMESQPRILQNL